MIKQDELLELVHSTRYDYDTSRLIHPLRCCAGLVVEVELWRGGIPDDGIGGFPVMIGRSDGSPFTTSLEGARNHLWRGRDGHVWQREYVAWRESER